MTKTIRFFHNTITKVIPVDRDHRITVWLKGDLSCEVRLLCRKSKTYCGFIYMHTWELDHKVLLASATQYTINEVIEGMKLQVSEEEFGSKPSKIVAHPCLNWTATRFVNLDKDCEVCLRIDYDPDRPRGFKCYSIEHNQEKPWRCPLKPTSSRTTAAMLVTLELYNIDRFNIERSQGLSQRLSAEGIRL